MRPRPASSSHIPYLWNQGWGRWEQWGTCSESPLPAGTRTSGVRGWRRPHPEPVPLPGSDPCWEGLDLLQHNICFLTQAPRGPYRLLTTAPSGMCSLSGHHHHYHPGFTSEEWGGVEVALQNRSGTPTPTRPAKQSRGWNPREFANVTYGDAAGRTGSTGVPW